MPSRGGISATLANAARVADAPGNFAGTTINFILTFSKIVTLRDLTRFFTGLISIALFSVKPSQVAKQFSVNL